MRYVVVGGMAVVMSGALEQLLELAEASGALQRAREDKQRLLDETWHTS